MRWTLNCILLASIAVISATEDDARIKRDLTFIKNLIAGKFLGYDTSPEPESPKIFVRRSDDYKLFRIPGFDKVLVKATPKKPGVVNVSPTIVQVAEVDAVEENPSVAIVNSYLGTSQLNETLFALQGVKNLLQSGVLEARRESMSERLGSYPQVYVEPGKIVVDGAPRPVAIGGPIDRFMPVEIAHLPELPIPTSYSYKQVNHGGEMTYTAKDNQNVIVTETNKPMPLPPYLACRIEEVMSIGAHRAPSVQLVPPPVQMVPPAFVSSGYSYNQVHTPHVHRHHVHLASPPIKVVSPHAPSSYSYNQISKDGSMTTYSGSGNVIDRKDDRPVVIAEVSKPASLPVFLADRIENAAVTAMIAKVPEAHVVPTAAIVRPPIPVYNKVPNVQFVPPPVRVMPSAYMPTGFSYSQVHTPHVPRPHVHVASPPIKVPVSDAAGSYSYNQISKDGSLTTYSGSGKVIDQKGERPVVVTEISKPAPLPVFLANRIENAAVTAMVAKVPNPIPHITYERPEDCDPPVIVEEKPAYFYNPVHHMPPHGVHHYNKPLYREDIHLHFSKHRDQRPVVSKRPSGFSYKTVHDDGSVSTYSDSGVYEENKSYVKNTPNYYPTVYSDAYNYDSYHPHMVREETYLEPPSDHYSTLRGHTEAIVTKPTGYSYKTVHGTGHSTTYSSSGNVEHEVLIPHPSPVPNPHALPVANPLPPVMVPEFVTPEEFFEGDEGRVMFAQPILSQYVYKQINHNNPNELTVADVGPIPLNGQVNVKVGTLPVPNVTPLPYVSSPVAPILPVLPSVTPSEVNVLMSTNKPHVAESGETPSSHSFTHVTNDGVHSHKDGVASFESGTSGPVVKIVKSSSSTSTVKNRTPSTPKFGKRVRTTTTTTTPKVISLSTNPIVVMPEEQTFSFKQDRADGSSITMVGNQDKLTVIEDNNGASEHRGDIPSTSL